MAAPKLPAVGHVATRPDTALRKRAGRADAARALSGRRTVRLALAGLGGLALTLAALWLAILYMPIPASQVAPRVSAAIQQRLGDDYVVSVADAELHRGGQGVELRLVDLAIARRDGPVVAEAPRVELRVDGLSLLTGSVRVRSVHVTKPRLDMQFEQAVGAASVQADMPRRIRAAIADLDRLLGPDGAAGALEEVDVSEATVRVSAAETAPLLNGVDLRLSRAAGGSLALTASAARSHERWTTAVTVSAEDAAQARTIDLGLENVDLGPYVASFARKAGAPPLSGRLSGHLNARIGPQGKLLAGDGRVSARALRVAVPGEPDGTALDFSAVDIDLGWDAAADAVVIERAALSGSGGRATFAGRVLSPAGDGVWKATLQGRDVLLSGGAAGEPPLRLDLIALDAAFDARAGALEIARGQFIGPTAKAALSGVVRFGASTPAVRLGLVADPMPASAAKKLWPFLVASQARQWALENVADGSIDSLTLSLDVPAGALAEGAPLPEGSMALAVAFSNGRLRPKPGLPWVEQSRGRVEAVAGRVDVIVDQGQIPGANGVLALSNLKFEVTETAARYPKAVARFDVDGALDPVLALLSSGALGPSPLPARLDPARTSGKLSADVTVRFELGHPDGEGPPTRVDLTAAISDASFADVAGGRGFEKGAFTIRLADGRTDISGTGSLAGAPVSVAVTEVQPAPDQPRVRRLTATLKADGATLERFGFQTFGRLRGTAPLEASLSLDEPGSPISVSADLKALAIDGVVPGFRKAAGDPGRLSLTIAPDGDRTAIRNFVLESGERRVHGALALGPKGELVSASFPIYRPSPGDDARIDVDKSRVGAVKVSLQGSALDLRPLVEMLRGKSEAARSGGADAGTKSGAGVLRSLDLQAKLGTGVGFGGEAMAGIDARLAMRDGKVTDADGSARIGAGPIRLATGEDGRFRLTGDDAGALFRFADLYGRIEGGRYDLSASLVGGPGLLRVRDFAVRNEAAIARVQQTAAGARGGEAGATRFDRLRVAFVEGDGRVDIREAALAGPQYGATLEGQVDYAGDRVALVGTFVPAYALNNFFARLPLIGGLLGGDRNGGLVGVTFRVTGKTGAPTITVNPVSAVAPGALRKMFEFRRQDAGTTGSAPADPAPAPAPGRR